MSQARSRARSGAQRMTTRTETPQHETYEALRAEIARRHPRFSDRLQVIAEFALDHPTDMALGTVAEVAQRAKVQPSAIVRFARALGYGGFTEMQQVFRSRLVASVAPSYQERIAGLRRDGRFRDTQQSARACWRASPPKAWSRWRACRTPCARRTSRAPSRCWAPRTPSTCWDWAARSPSPRTSPTCCASSAGASCCWTGSAARSASRRRRPRRRTR